MKAEINEGVKNPINKMIEDKINIELELREKTLAKVIQENDFVVNNAYMKAVLEEGLPQNAKISISPYVEENTVIMIKKAILEPHLLPIDFNELNEQEGNNE